MSAPTGPVFRYPGSKWLLGPWIISHFPKRHETFVELFFGSGGVFFQKAPSRSEYVNDLDGEIVRFFRVLRERGVELAELLAETPYSREEYVSAFDESEDELENARRFLIRHQMSVAGNGGARYRSGWRHNGPSNSHGGVVGQWRKRPEIVMACSSRLLEAQIEQMDARYLVPRLDDTETLFYADPPYLNGTRSRPGKSGKLYRQEMMSPEAHLQLLDALDEARGMVVLSGYPSDLYDERLSHWARYEKLAYGEQAAQRTEVIWVNPACAIRLEQERLAVSGQYGSHGPLFGCS